MTAPPDVRRAEEAARAKAALRARFRARRQALNPEAYAERSAAIGTRAAALPELAAARTVHIYWPLVARGEIDTRPLIRRLVAEGKTVVLPAVVSLEPDVPPRLRHLRYRGEEALRSNRWGVCEPTGNETVPLEKIDVVIVPALGAGRNGHRIGHGRGFYDAFLSSIAAPRIGLVYAGCLADVVPAEPHDVALSIIVTERETIRFGAGPAPP